MNLKILTGILLYYSLVSLFFVFGSDTFNTTSGYTSNANISALDTGEQSDGWLTGFSFTRWWLFVNFGILIGTDAPFWFQAILFIWQTSFTIFVVGWLFASIWNG